MTRVKTRSRHLLPPPNPTTTGLSNFNGPSKSRPTSSQTRRLNGLHSSRTGSQQISTANDILSTDPEQTKSLWHAVRYHVHRQAMPPKKGRNKGKGPANSAGSSVLQQEPHGEPGREGPALHTRSRSQKRKHQDMPGEDPIPLDALESASRITSKTLATATTKKTKMIVEPRDIYFREYILEPRGITINSRTRSQLDPYTHFASGHTAETIYKELEGFKDLSIWLETDSEFLRETAAEYDCMKSDNMCEAEFARFGKERLLKGEPRTRQLPEDRKYRPERMIELVAKPSVDDKWIEPPILFSDPSASTRLYDFDIRPDCAYWLSLQAFNKSWRSRIEEYVLVMYRRVAFPYFTIEFKRDDSTGITAENQIAVAGAMALFNRYSLRSEHLQLAKKKEQVSDIACLKHYSATFSGCHYSLWCIEPKLAQDGTWSGCTMSRIFRDNCDMEEGLRSCVQWLNEIHAWGLTKYGPACQRDLKGCMKAQGLRMSDIGMNDDAPQDTGEHAPPE